MADRKKIAAIVTAYYPRSHADVVVTKFLKGFPTDKGLLPPEVDVVSMYLDQVHERDIGRDMAREFGVPMFETQAVRCEGHACHSPSSCACRSPGACK